MRVRPAASVVVVLSAISLGAAGAGFALSGQSADYSFGIGWTLAALVGVAGTSAAAVRLRLANRVGSAWLAWTIAAVGWLAGVAACDAVLAGASPDLLRAADVLWLASASAGIVALGLRAPRGSLSFRLFLLDAAPIVLLATALFDIYRLEAREGTFEHTLALLLVAAFTLLALMTVAFLVELGQSIGRRRAIASNMTLLAATFTLGTVAVFASAPHLLVSPGHGAWWPSLLWTVEALLLGFAGLRRAYAPGDATRVGFSERESALRAIPAGLAVLVIVGFEPVAHGSVDGPVLWLGLAAVSSFVARTLLVRRASGQLLTALLGSEARVRAAIAAAPAGIGVWHPDGTLIDANPALEAMLGYTRDELRGMHWRDIVEPEDQQLTIDRLAERDAEGRSSCEMEIRYLRKNGSHVWVRLALAAIADSLDTSQLTLSTAEDVTERRAVREELRRQNAELEALHETALGLIDGLELDHLLEAIVRRAAALLEAEDAYIALVDPSGMTMSIRCGTGFNAELREHGFEIRRGIGITGAVWETGRLQVVNDYGSWSQRNPVIESLDVKAVAAAPLHAGAELVGVLGLSRTREGRPFGPNQTDLLTRFGRLASLALENARLYEAARQEIEERRQTEVALRESEQHFRELVTGIGAIVWEYDLRADRKVFVNERAEELLGYSLAEWFSPTFWETHIHPGDVEETMAKALAELEAGRDHELEYRMVAADGRVIWLRDIVKVLRDEDGNPARLRGVAIDLTATKEAEQERDRLETQLRHGQKMEAIGRLAGGVAHDFNNLLLAIDGYSQFALDRLGADSNAARADLEEVLRASNRAAALTRQLLAFSRRQVLEPRVIDLNDVAAGVERMLRRLIGEDVELVTRLDPELQPVSADPGQLEQVIANLAVNARDAMPDGGRLTIATHDVTLGARRSQELGLPPGRYAMLAVSDTGEGMDDATRSRAVEPFFTTKEPGKGTGLGLSTVDGIVTQSGGTLQLLSALGEGTTIEIYLPAVAAAAEEEPCAPLVEAPRGSETILLVEDEEIVRTLVSKMLEKQGYRVTAAASGRDALALLESGAVEPDLVVTDLVMPEMGGWALGERLGQERPGQRILYVSGYAEELTRRGIDGTFAFLEKPFTAETLGAKVRDVLDLPAAEQSRIAV